MKSGKSGLTDYGMRVTALLVKSREELVGIYVKLFGVSPKPSVPKHRLCQLIADREAVYDRDGNLFNS